MMQQYIRNVVRDGLSVALRVVAAPLPIYSKRSPGRTKCSLKGRSRPCQYIRNVVRDEPSVALRAVAAPLPRKKILDSVLVSIKSNLDHKIVYIQGRMRRKEKRREELLNPCIHFVVPLFWAL